MRLYGTLDLVFAALYAWFGFSFTPGRSTSFNVALAVVCGALAIAGIGLLLRAPWGRLAGIAASALLVTFTIVVVALMVASSAYLSSVYGALGRGMAVMTLAVAALMVELFGLLPLFQLRFLLRTRQA